MKSNLLAMNLEGTSGVISIAYAGTRDLNHEVFCPPIEIVSGNEQRKVGARGRFQVERRAGPVMQLTKRLILDSALASGARVRTAVA
jgi:hypothetical protein